MADEGGSTAGAAPAFKKPAFRKKGGDAKAKQVRKRAREESNSDDSGSSEEESILLIKQAKKGGSKAAKADGGSAVPLGAYASNRSVVPVQMAGGATHEYQIDTEHGGDSRALMEEALKVQEDGQTNDDTKVYRGQAFYKNYIPKDKAQIGGNKFTGTQGPIRAPTYLRSTCVFDYKPDICKDYKETGFCGFGDACKFIHDRSDYKSGYELEAEWDAEQKKKRMKEMGEWADESDDDDAKYVIDADEDLPFACFLCRDGFKDPVVTVCGHYFCSTCALEHNKKDPKCPACGERTGGVFNMAKRLFEKLRKEEAKKVAKLEREKARSVLIGEPEKGGGEAEEGGEEGEGEEEKLRIEEVDKHAVVKQRKGAWSTV